MKIPLLPIAEEISATQLSLPLYYGMTEEEIQYVIDCNNEYRSYGILVCFCSKLCRGKYCELLFK